MKKILMIIHTELLNDDQVWSRALSLLHIPANWFSIKPDQDKWKERLRYLKSHDQAIGQHTHFYQNKKGTPYDLSPANVLKKVIEDKKQLGVVGFLSGAWQINQNVLDFLSAQDYKYDFSENDMDLQKGLKVRKVNGLTEIPAKGSISKLLMDLITFRIKRRALDYNGEELYTLHFHDYDLKNTMKFFALKVLLFLLKLSNFQFVTYENIDSHRNISS